MTTTVALGVYFICWWMVLFAILPFGVRVPEDGEERPLGTADSAPVQPYLLRKFAATTVISAILFAIVYAVVTWRLVSFDWLPASL